MVCSAVFHRSGQDLTVDWCLGAGLEGRPGVVTRSSRPPGLKLSPEQSEQSSNVEYYTVGHICNSYHLLSEGSRTIRKSAKVVTMSLEGGPPPASASDSLGVRS